MAGEKWADPEVIYKIDIPGFGGHQQWVERGGLVWTALVFDPSHVTLLFILVTKPRDGHTIIIPILWNRNSFGEGKQEPASARTHIPHHWTSCPPTISFGGQGTEPDVMDREEQFVWHHPARHGSIVAGAHSV